MPLQLNITTKRLLLKRVDVGDYRFIKELVNTPGWLQFIGDRHVHSDEEAMAYITKINSLPLINYWIVWLTETEQPIGLISFIKRTYLEHFDIGFAFLPQYSGNGYAYEAAAAILSYVHALPEHSVVLATTVPGNIRSISLLKKLGLHFQNEIEVEGQPLQVYSTEQQSQTSKDDQHN